MSNRDNELPLDYVPEDVLEEVLKETSRKELKQTKKPYPSARDIVETIIIASAMARSIHPDEFPQLVIKMLEDKGFDTRHVTVKRIWRTYEKLVREGTIRDVLGVVEM